MALLTYGRQPQDGPNTEANLTGNLADADALGPHGQCGFDLAVAVSTPRAKAIMTR